MRAAILFEQGKPQRVEDVALDAPHRGEVLVRMAASGVCHSCRHAADGSWAGVPVPIVLGDEGAGVVEALGHQAGKLRIDELITHRYALEDANEAFRALAAGELRRGVIVF
jgi:Zn-dependent alcohol dehydrogenase